MTRRPDPERIADAQRAGLESEQRDPFDRDWTRYLAPTTSPAQHRELLESMSPAMRELAEAWRRR